MSTKAWRFPGVCHGQESRMLAADASPAPSREVGSVGVECEFGC